MRPAARTLYRQPSFGRRILRNLGPFFSSSQAQRLQPERRSGMRILTLKNAAWFTLTAVVLFLIFSSYMERRSRGSSNYGRLYDERIDATQKASPTTTDTAPRH
ncbi:MAG TPA: hypothetical protein VE974_05620 [Thermoanaerobaculia bacterium]|nr:hypothetical protein [Thermoanaerobaculia bacterium]